MTRIDILNKINEYFINDSLESKQTLIQLMNNIIIDGEYKNHLDLFFIMIILTQLYGFLAYLNDEEKNYFFLSDYFVSNSYSSIGLDYLNSGQLSLLHELSLYQKVFISAPTSFGKTSIVNDFVLKNIEKYSLIVYVVPTNSLLEELYIKFSTHLIGKKNINISTQPCKKDVANNILFLTPERFLIFYEENGMEDINLIVMDETYKIMDFKNKAISDFVNSRSFRFRRVADIIAKSNSKSIYLSPFTYELTESMRRFLEKHDIKKIDRKIEYVTHEIINVSGSPEFKLLFPKTNNKYLKSYTSAKKTVTIVNELVEERNIVYTSSYNKAYKIASNLTLDQIKIKKTDRFTKFISHLDENFTIDEKTKWNVISSLEKGIGIYISPVPRYIKREMIRLFEEGVLHTMIVTTSFTEGVNTSAKNLIFTSLQSGGTKLTDIDVLNVAGRAGRFGKNSIGKIYCINEEIYSKILQLREENLIKLENYNYYLENNDSESTHIDYEIEMMDEEYLSEDEIIEKQFLDELIKEHGLTKEDLNISLNVSNRWKLYLYDWFIKNEKSSGIYYEAILNLIVEESKIKSIELIFETIKKCFDSGQDIKIDPFPINFGSIRAFDNSDKFIWGRLYGIFASGTTINVIRENRKYIRGEYQKIMINQNTSEYKEIQAIFKRENKEWIIAKYYQRDNKTENSNAFYTETFRFISDIVQYKIPYYLSYFVSVFKVYARKNETACDFSKIDIRQIIMSFEEGILDDENLSSLIDYGLSNDLVRKIKNNNISLNTIMDQTFQKDVFDEFELLLLEDFRKIME